MRWTDAPPAEAARSVIHRHWRLLGTWTPRDWTLNLASLAVSRKLGYRPDGHQRHALDGRLVVEEPCRPLLTG